MKTMNDEIPNSDDNYIVIAGKRRRFAPVRLSKSEPTQKQHPSSAAEPLNP